MATVMDFSRAVNKDIQLCKDKLFDGYIDFTRDDSVDVDFTGKTMIMDVMRGYAFDPLLTMTSGTEITIAAARLLFNKIITELERETYTYLIYNDTDKICVQYGNVDVI